MGLLAEFENVSFSYTENDKEKKVFTDLDLTIPDGVTAVMGPNAAGKSTLLLLAGGRMHPVTGKVTLLGTDTLELADEAKRSYFASFIFQNMEFETEEPIRDLLPFVLQNGHLEDKDPALVDKFIQAFSLDPILDRKTNEISKGELQRTILAFSLLFGSKSIMMDEPLFAMEDGQKERAMQFVTEYAQNLGIPLLFSVHEIELGAEAAQNIILLSADGTIQSGPVDDIYTTGNIEEAYQVPWEQLHHKKHLTREQLIAISEGKKRIKNNR